MFRTSCSGAGLAAVLLALGCRGPAGERGAPGPPGPAGPSPAAVPATNTVLGVVTSGATRLAGVLVTTFPAAGATTTSGMGSFSLPALDVGVYDLSFHLPGFLDQTITVSVPGGAPVKVAVALVADETGGSGGPVVTVADQLDAGFGAAVEVPVEALGNGPFTYAWTQTGGPAATLAGAATSTLAFTTRGLASAIGPTAVENARFDTLGLNLDQTNDYRFQLVVTDANGLATTTVVAVESTRPTLGLRMAPVGVPVWLQGNGPLFPIGSPPAAQTSWSWSLDASGVPGSAASLAEPSSQFPHFTPDVAGTYLVKESVANLSMLVYAGTWQGEMTDASESDCVLCHDGKIAPDVFTPWKKTKHYTAMQRAIDGAEGQGFTAPCLRCHSVGYDPSAANNGFDDVASASGWTVPAVDQPGNWATLEAVPKLGQLAGIQCESCHGPQAGTSAGPHANAANLDIRARIKWSGDLCVTCHQESPTYYQGAQWSTSAHADRTLSVSAATVESLGTGAADCGRCHAAQGFAAYARQLSAGYAGPLTTDGQAPAPGNPSPNAATTAWMTGLGLAAATVEPQTCAACHDPHDATNPSQLRLYDAVASLPNGMTGVSGMGTGVTCAACHGTASGEHSDFVAAPTSYAAPHAATQTDVVFGFNAYFTARLTPSAHLGVENTCAGCHYAAVTASQAAAKQTSNHSFAVDSTVCATCHSSNVDGVALQAAYESELDALGVAIAGKVLNLIDQALLPSGGAAYTVRAWDPASDQYSSTGAPNLVLTVAPVSIDHTVIHGQLGFVLHMPSPVQVALVTGVGAPAGSIQTADVYVVAGSLSNGVGTSPLFTADSDYVRALWNYDLLKADGTKGIHNPAFYDGVIDATTARVATLP